MLLRQERFALALITLVVIGIAGGTVLLSGIDKGALASEYHQDESDGSLVCINGTIEELRKTETGGHLIAEITGTTIFIPSNVASKVTLRKGDCVMVIGIVQTYRGTKEIIVQDARDVRITE